MYMQAKDLYIDTNGNGTPKEKWGTAFRLTGSGRIPAGSGRTWPDPVGLKAVPLGNIKHIPIPIEDTLLV